MALVNTPGQNGSESQMWDAAQVNASRVLGPHISRPGTWLRSNVPSCLLSVLFIPPTASLLFSGTPPHGFVAGVGLDHR